ncbi:MAG: UDP-N,N'-diacetylbacillosamine 2-epimerase (hydrolyzing) [Ignavibacteriaceae bacterium]|nr:UDP-N,N'-diacetylbacillosamine 2-epimerase (hydrolyzing) [Ignavibacteriaceae bacterium]
MKRKICVVITARPSYSRIKSALHAINESENLELLLVIGASALLDRYGSTIKYIERDGFTIAEQVYFVLEGENPTSMAKTTGLGVLELANVFYNLKPDMVVTIADRYETIATAIAASYQNIPLVHIQGGEVTGNIDEKVRHAITKLADIHLVATEGARNRVVMMGEDPEYVINTGCPSIDLAKKISKEETLLFNPYDKYGGVGYTPDITSGFLVVMQHPVTTEFQLARTQILETLKAVHELNLPTLWFWPNVDAGADGTSNGIRNFREKNNPANIHFFKNMEPEDFLRLINHSMCLIGNSSVGIRESGYLGTPVVNIGSRQHQRERSSNVIEVEPSSGKIIEAIQQQLTRGKYSKSDLYGEGDSGKKIADVLERIKLRFHKTIRY